MRPRRSPRFSTAARCRAVQAFRRRMDAAEARADAAERARDAAQAERCAALASVARERGALQRWLDSPEWERDLLVMARARLRDALGREIAARGTCNSCGGLGRGLYANLLSDTIEALEAAHGLAPAGRLPDPDWTDGIGERTLRGARPDRSWLRASWPDRRAPKAEPARAPVDNGGPRATFF